MRRAASGNALGRGCTRARSAQHDVDLLEVGVGVFELSSMVRSACSNQYIRRRDSHTGTSASAGQCVCSVPHGVGNCEFWHESLKLLEYAFLPVPTGAVPQLETNERTPPCRTRLKRDRHTMSRCRVSVAAKKMNPRRRVDEHLARNRFTRCDGHAATRLRS